LPVALNLESHIRKPAGFGRIRIGAWRPYRARRVPAVPEGFVWAATTRLAGLPLRGSDRYSRGRGQVRWRLLGVLPVQSNTGPDVTRSAAARLASEFIITPAVGLDPAVRWTQWTSSTRWPSFRSGRSPTRSRSASRPPALELVSLSHWGDPDGAGFAERPFTALVHDEHGSAVSPCPPALRRVWHGTEHQASGEFIWFTVDAAAHR
jgi:hypothetical protein